MCAESISRCSRCTCLVSAEEENRMNSFNSVCLELKVQVRGHDPVGIIVTPVPQITVRKSQPRNDFELEKLGVILIFLHYY